MWKAMRSAGKSYGVDELTGDDKRWIVRLEGSTHTRPMYMPLTHTAERIAAMDKQGHRHAGARRLRGFFRLHHAA